MLLSRNCRAAVAHALLPLGIVAAVLASSAARAQEVSTEPELQPSRFMAFVTTRDLPPSEPVTTTGDEPSQSADESAINGRPSAELRGDGSGVSSSPRRFHYSLHVSARGVYDDNIYLTRYDRKEGFYFGIEPGFSVGFGDVVGRQENYIRFDYSLSAFIFADNSDADSVQHLFRLEGQYRFARLTLTLSQDINLLEGANLSGASFESRNPGVNIDTGGTTDVNLYATRAAFSYDLSGKTSLSGGLDYYAREYHELLSSESISANAFINFAYSPKLTIGVGGTLGYNSVEAPSPNETFEQVNARVTYQATGKVSLNATAGVEFRQFEDSSRGQYSSPVFGIGAIYLPFDATTVNLRAGRRTVNSAVFYGQDYASTNIVLSVSQRLLRRLTANVTVGYENSDYFSTLQGVSATREDDYFYIQPALDFNVTRFWSIGAYYLHRDNDSSFDTFSFYDNQVGLRSTVSF